MSTLLLKFGIHLEKYELPTVAQHHGPLFHRWFPDGEKDAIILNTGDPNTKLKLWFERWGYIDNGWIKFSYKRREVDPKIIPTQAILDAGPLLGLLEIRGVAEEELTPLRENKVGDARYISLAKRVVKLLYPTVARFLNILRTNYGQYWIQDLEKWDSRRESLGSYCQSFELKWRLDNGKTWIPFVPDKPEGRLTLVVRENFREYLTKENWQELAKIVQEGYEPSPAAFILTLAHQFLDQGNLKHAFIEGVSTLEIALNEFIRQRLYDAGSLLKSMKAFWNLPLSTQVTTIATTLGNISLQDIKHTIKAIDIRNKVIHKSLNPPENTMVELSALLNTAAALLLGPKFRFPTANPGNARMSLEKWNQQVQEDRHSG